MLNTVGDLPLTRNATDAFRYRHLGTTPVQQEEMAQSAGFESVQELIETTVPDNIKLQTALNLPPALSESDADKASTLRRTKQSAQKLYRHGVLRHDYPAGIT